MIDDMDMGDVLDCFLQDVILKTVTITSVNFDETETVTEQNIRAVVQPADPKKLTADNIDWSLENHQIHSKSVFEVGQFIEYNGKDFKIIWLKPYGDYGYYEGVMEATDRTVK